MKRVFVYEYLSGGGPMDGSEAERAGLLALGRSMRDAIAADLIRIDDCEVSVATCAAAPTVPARAAAVAPRDAESAFDFVARLADANHAVWVVAPETDGLLAGLQRSVDPARWIGCDAPSIALASGKRATLMRLAAAGVNTPLAFEHAPEIARWVVKPDDGAGATQTRVHADRDAAWDDWSQRSRGGSATAIEPWVEGDALSLSLLCTGVRCELLSVNRQQLSLDAGGMLSYRGVEVNVMPTTDARRPTLAALAADVARAVPGLRGFVGIDIVWHAQRGPVVIEVNPRVTCAYVGLSQALGRNLAAETLAAHSAGTGHAEH